MLQKTAIAAFVLIFFGPSLVFIGMGVLMNPAASAAACTIDTGLTLGPVPNELSVTTADGATFTLSKAQLTHAATIIKTGSKIDGVTRDGIQIALMAALTESSLRMLTNTSTYPESSSYPNDGNGSDHDSLGLFQMRPAAGWGTVAELMNPVYQAKAFFGGPTGPNSPSPRGLLDIPGWQKMDKGEAAQAVEVSAYPDRYRNYEPVANTILTTLIQPTAGGGNGSAVPETSRVVFPLPAGTWIKTSVYGIRVHPITGIVKLHTGTDYAAPAGTPILAAADGTVSRAGPAAGFGNLIVIDHTVGGQRVATGYAHMYDNGIRVKIGDRVTAGQRIADVGSSGNSTGPHLHFELYPGGTGQPTSNPEPWLNSQGAEGVDIPSDGNRTGCTTGASQGADPTGFDGSDPDRMVPDPTGTGGQVTARTRHLHQQATSAFPNTSWACWSPRPGTVSEHPLGRACDITFGNAIGQQPTPAQLETGWALTNWMKTHARILGVEYLIWQNKIWSLARDSEGWRPYAHGTDITTKHIDHLHVTTTANQGAELSGSAWNNYAADRN